MEDKKVTQLKPSRSTGRKSQKSTIEALTREVDKLNQQNQQMAQQYTAQLNKLNARINIQQSKLNTRYQIMCNSTTGLLSLFRSFSWFKKRSREAENFIAELVEENENS